MKVIFLVTLVMAAIGVTIYYAGGLKGFDPSRQGLDAKAKIGPGMKWTAVLDITGAPSKFQPLIAKQQRIGGQDMEFIEVGPGNKFSRENIERRLADKSLPHGFLCTFLFSDTVAFTVKFDGDGLVENVNDAPTMADLLQTRD